MKRELDLSAAKAPAKAAKAPRKPALTERQAEKLAKAEAALRRWHMRLIRAASAIEKHQRKVNYYRKLGGLMVLLALLVASPPLWAHPGEHCHIESNRCH